MKVLFRNLDSEVLFEGQDYIPRLNDSISYDDCAWVVTHVEWVYPEPNPKATWRKRIGFPIKPIQVNILLTPET